MMIADTPMLSAIIHTAKVLTNCIRMEIGMSFTIEDIFRNRRASSMPRATPPPHVNTSMGRTCHPEKLPVTAAAAAMR